MDQAPAGRLKFTFHLLTDVPFPPLMRGHLSRRGETKENCLNFVIERRFFALLLLLRRVRRRRSLLASSPLFAFLSETPM